MSELFGTPNPTKFIQIQLVLILISNCELFKIASESSSNMFLSLFTIKRRGTFCFLKSKNLFHLIDLYLEIFYTPITG